VAQSDLKVTEHEGLLLALVLRQQPVTAYQLFKIFEQSPVTSINASKGQLYPAIRRLKARGFLTARKVAGDGRNAEDLQVTATGAAAVRAWTKGIDASHVVRDDPFRTRILSFDVLTKQERLEWIAKAKAIIKERRRIVDEYDSNVDVPYQEFAYRSVIETLRVKMEWLDELLYRVASSD